MWLPFLIAFLSPVGGAAVDGNESLDAASITHSATSDLTARWLTTEQARDVVSHEVVMQPPLFLNGTQSFYVLFYSRARMVAPSLCQRDTCYVSQEMMAQGSAVPPPASVGAQLALGATCSEIDSRNFAFVQPNASINGAILALQQLARLQSDARRSRLRRVEVNCRTILAGNHCAGGGVATLRRLPLDSIYIIEPLDHIYPVEPNRVEAWRFAVMPSGPPHAYYNLRVEQSRRGLVQIYISWQHPAPF